MLTVLETVILTGVILPGSDSAVPPGSESVFLTCRACSAAVAAVGTAGARGGQAVWQAGDRLVSHSSAPARQQPGTEERPSNPPRCWRPARRVPARVCDRPACGGSRGRGPGSTVTRSADLLETHLAASL